MKTTRTRMLIVFAAASVVISFFMHWDWDGFSRGFYDGFHDARPPIHGTR
jgi:hypothetical protein